MEFPVYRPQSGAMEMWDIMIHSESEKHGKKYKYIPVLVIVEILRTTICFWEWCVAVFWCMPLPENIPVKRNAYLRHSVPLDVLFLIMLTGF